MKLQGQIIELDSKKDYILIVKKDSILDKEVRQGHIDMKSGRIFFVGDMDEFRFIENSDRIIDVIKED